MAEKKENMPKLERQRLEYARLQKRMQSDSEKIKRIEAEIIETEKTELHNKAMWTLLPIDAVFAYVDKLGALSRGEITRPEFDLFLDELHETYGQRIPDASSSTDTLNNS